MLLVVMLLGLVTALFVFGLVDSSSFALRRDEDTTIALAQVKQALIGWSAARTPTGGSPNIRPGELPCPDFNNTGNDPGGCSAGAIGRVPWKSLGIPEPKDSAGETLWYAIAGPFRNYSQSTAAINSDTRGTITVYQDSTANAITTEAVAVIFAPGLAVGTQNRDPVATALCPTTGTTIAMNLCAANYLETAATVNNATTNGPFISAQSSSTFNDKLLVITTADLMPPVEQRVARELRTILCGGPGGASCLPQSYKAVVGVYPWADCSDGVSDVTPSPSSNVDGSNRGRIPWQTAYPMNWGSGGAPYLPGGSSTNVGWFVNNNWSWVIYYAVGKSYLEAAGARCSTCEAGQTSLSVDGVWGKEVVLLTTGPAGASRPGTGALGRDIVGPWGTVNWPPGNCNPVSPTWQAWQAYLEDSENYDLSNDRYVTPSSTAYTRDRIFTIP